jgi:stearoyl-CoA desaturase (delta-9 desaturase)
VIRVLVTAFAAGFVVTMIAQVCSTVFLHRALSHRAVSLSPPVTQAFRFMQWITTGIRPRQWVAVHRKHHAFTDVDGDPHSPKLLGWPAVQFGNIGLYRKVSTDPEQVHRYARDLPQDRWDKVLFDRSWLGLTVGITFLVIVFGPWIGLLAAAFHAGMYLGLNAAVNAITHTFGKRPFDNTATNLQWLAFLTLGEGLHNNHHAAPTSAKFSLNRGNVDLAWPLIRISRRLGLMTIRHDEVKLKQPTGV